MHPISPLELFLKGFFSKMDPKNYYSYEILPHAVQQLFNYPIYLQDSKQGWAKDKKK